MTAQSLECPLRLGLGDEGHHAALAGHVERIQSQQLTGPRHGLVHRHGGLVHLEAHPGIERELVERGGQPSARGIAQAVHLHARLEEGRHQRGERGAVTLHGRLELEALAHREHRDAVPPHVAGDEHRVTRPHAPGMDGHALGDAARRPRC